VLIESAQRAGLPDGVFKPKVQIWFNFGGPWNEKSWYILWPFSKLVAIWHIFPRFGIFNKEKYGNHARGTFLNGLSFLKPGLHEQRKWSDK
jgi:hypothetical protein